MLNFKNTNIVVVLLLIVIIGFNVFASIPLVVYGIIVLVYLSVVFYGCYFIKANFFLPVICFATTDKKEIAISFDDGPAINYTAEILEILKLHHIKATFFCIGKKIKGNEKLLLQIHQEGHLLGNHSFSHHNLFDLFSAKKMMEDLQMMDKEMENVTGLQPKLFRPPYGVTNPNLKKAIVQGGYTPVGWSVRSLDTVIKNEVRLLKKSTKKLQPGDIFLFHDTSKVTVAILPAFINWVKENGYQIVPLDKMLNLKPYA